MKFGVQEKLKLFDKLPESQRYAVIKQCDKETLDKNDGVAYVNISGHANTKLGKMLCFFSKCRFKHPKFGTFTSLEGLWWWLKTMDRPDKLRALHGKAANNEGRKHATAPIADFTEFVLEGIFASITQNKALYDELMQEPRLPIVSYYFSGSYSVPTVSDGRMWVQRGIESIRQYLTTVELKDAKFEDVEFTFNRDSDMSRGKPAVRTAASEQTTTGKKPYKKTVQAKKKEENKETTE